MSTPYVRGISFYDDCPACGRRITGSSRIVLNDNLAKHEAKCFPRTAKKINKAKAAAAQPDLFSAAPAVKS